MKHPTECNKLTWALYGWNWRYPFFSLKHLLKDIHIFFYRIGFLMKHGYAEAALFEGDSYFIDSWTEILTNYRFKATGYPGQFVDSDGAEWYNILDRMLWLLGIMGWDENVLDLDEMM